MNKEEIIIDGVDVRFCQYFNDKNKKCRACSYVEGIKYTSYKCENDKNCYYKQHQRLKEENVKLKKALEEIRTFAKPIKENTCFGMYCGFIDFVLETIDEVTTK